MKMGRGEFWRRSRQRKLEQGGLRRIVGALAKVGQGQSEQPDSLRRRKQIAKEAAADFEKFLASADRAVEAPRPSDDLEILIFDLERHGPPADPLFADPSPHGLTDPVELGGESRFFLQIIEEGVLGADRFPRPVRLDLTMADTAREVVIILPAAAEIVLEEGEALGAKIGPCLDS